MQNWNYILFSGAVIAISAFIFVHHHGLPFTPQLSERCIELSAPGAERLDSTIDELDACIEECGDDSPEALGPLYYSRALKNNKYKRYQAAIDDLSQCIALEYNIKQALYLRGGNFYENNQPWLAVDDFARAEQFYPRDIHLQESLAFLYQWLKNIPKSMEHINKAIRLDRNWPGFYVHRYELYRDLHQYDSALADINKAIDLMPSRKGYRRLRGSILTKLGRYRDAIADFRWEIAQNQKDQWSCRRLAECYRKVGNTSSALFYERKATALRKKRR